ncbi:MAG TPA: hypothetical protein VNT01_15785 [Symbiobacteriaceae bacterium]|nr:hypothetical protein [Symbiobacteriaceae bacterium]
MTTLEPGTHALGRWLLVLIPILLLPTVLWWGWPQPRAAVYSLYRERGRTQVLGDLPGYEKKSSAHVDVYFTEKDRNVADWVLQTTENVYGPVTTQVGYTPSDRVPMIIYPDRDELRHAFGWGNGESAMGVYWAGTVRLLSPNVWINEKRERDRRKVFDKLNPIAHELTHYMLDYLTNGNYPRWFTEGLAQRVEYRLTGYLWLEADSSLDQDLYSLSDLEERFDDLKNQPLAYRQSFLLVDYLAQTHGEQSLTQLVQALSSGTKFGPAVEAATGRTQAELYADWREWVDEHMEDLETAS